VPKDNPAAAVAAAIEGEITRLVERIPEVDKEFRAPLKAQLAQQERGLAYVKKQGRLA
jgi:hypothetical protein